jgi:DNA-binding CsgD family transcriptional regulator
VIIGFLWKRFGVVPLRSAPILLALGTLGFVAAIVSLFVPGLSLVACVLLGAMAACCWLVPFFGLLVAKNYPSRFISPAIIGIAFLAVLIHTALLKALRDNLTMLYVSYLVIAVALVILYLMLEPWLLYSFCGRTLQDIIGVAEEDPDGTESAPEKPEPAAPQPGGSRPPLLQSVPKTQAGLLAAAPPEYLALHERRMKILMTHALSPLTRREYQVADGIMRGLRRAEISREMDILPESITKYTNRIYEKFSIHRRQDLFRLAETLNREWDKDKSRTSP